MYFSTSISSHGTGKSVSTSIKGREGLVIIFPPSLKAIPLIPLNDPSFAKTSTNSFKVSSPSPIQTTSAYSLCRVCSGIVEGCGPPQTIGIFPFVSFLTIFAASMPK